MNKTAKEVYINIELNEMCDDCWSFPKAKFLKKPSFLFVETFVEENVDKLSIEDVPLSITIDNCVFIFYVEAFGTPIILHQYLD